MFNWLKTGHGFGEIVFRVKEIGGAAAHQIVGEAETPLIIIILVVLFSLFKPDFYLRPVILQPVEGP